MLLLAFLFLAGSAGGFQAAAVPYLTIASIIVPGLSIEPLEPDLAKTPGAMIES
jgi:hypothetical protein